MSPESLKIIASANVALSRFIRQASVDSMGQGMADDVSLAIETHLSSIATTLEEASRSIGPAKLSENLDSESRAQIDLYTQNLRTLKSLMSPLLASAEARRKHLRKSIGAFRQTMSWLNTLKSTGID